MFSSFVFFSLEALFTSLDSVIRSVSCYVLYLFLTCSARTVSRTIQPATNYLNNPRVHNVDLQEPGFFSPVIHAVNSLAVITDGNVGVGPGDCWGHLTN
jgi:hypothetical protein